MVFPNVFYQHAPCDDLIRVTHHVFKQFEFTRLKLYTFPATLDLSSKHIHMQVSNCQCVWDVSLSRPSRNSIQARQKLSKSKWFDQIVIRTTFQSEDSMIDIRAFADDQNGYLIATLPQLHNHPQPIDSIG